ncbi:MAG: hypothetical protein ACF8PN_08375 [Phycisphaerales bacterium]
MAISPRQPSRSSFSVRFLAPLIAAILWSAGCTSVYDDAMDDYLVEQPRLLITRVNETVDAQATALDELREARLVASDPEGSLRRLEYRMTDAAKAVWDAGRTLESVRDVAAHWQNELADDEALESRWRAVEPYYLEVEESFAASDDRLQSALVLVEEEFARRDAASGDGPEPPRDATWSERIGDALNDASSAVAQATLAANTLVNQIKATEDE